MYELREAPSHKTKNIEKEGRKERGREKGVFVQISKEVRFQICEACLSA